MEGVEEEGLGLSGFIIYIYIYIYISYHIVLPARIFLILSCHLSLSFIASGRSSRLYSMSVQSSRRLVLAGHPTLARRCEGVQRRTSLTGSSLILQQCPVCLVRLIWRVFEMGGGWLYNCWWNIIQSKLKSLGIIYNQHIRCWNFLLKKCLRYVFCYCNLLNLYCIK